VEDAWVRMFGEARLDLVLIWRGASALETGSMIVSKRTMAESWPAD
jgi:hypothetical protein